ncbi:MAG: thymidylate synthase [Methanothrix sp.]|nr:thymidylate synthase [Methanothrix sp.]MDD1740993.1 thymidylate synthase [Methanothrix sp.]OYV12954.1 MAG: thymidylate synthase [Methanosaeta sp. ASO1]
MAILGRFIRAASISDAWQRGLNLIWRQGAEITDERGTRIKEILSLQMVVEDPYREMIPAGYSWNEERLEEYARQLLSGSNPGFEYTYGERLRAWAIPGTPALDQIQQAIARLRASSSTRRATAVTWIVPVDSNKEEVPCMIVDDFKLRDGRLNLSIFFRSHDFAGAYPANLYGLARLLQYVAGAVGAEPGSISTTSASAHIYEHDWDWVERMLLGKGGEQI